MIRYKAILDNLYDGVYFVDKDRKITYWNRAAEQLTGYGRSEVIGKSCADNILTHIDAQGLLLCNDACPLKKTLDDGRTREAEVYLHHKDGHRVPVAIRLTPILDEQGNIIGAVELFNDISQQMSVVARMKELEDLALLDPLTGMGNRRYIEMTLDKRRHELQRYMWPCGMLFIDIDHFKEVNDTYGHETGDKVLRQVAQTLARNSRAFDVFGRLGGEEFIGIIRNVDGRKLIEIANKLRILVQAAYVMVGKTALHVTISVGATLLRLDDSVDAVLRRADKLMYQSKTNGRNMVTSDS